MSKHSVSVNGIYILTYPYFCPCVTTCTCIFNGAHRYVVHAKDCFGQKKVYMWTWNTGQSYIYLKHRDQKNEFACSVDPDEAPHLDLHFLLSVLQILNMIWYSLDFFIFFKYCICKFCPLLLWRFKGYVYISFSVVFSSQNMSDMSVKQGDGSERIICLIS